MLSKCAGWYFQVYALVWGFRTVYIVCPQTVGKRIFWKVRVGLLSLCSQVLLQTLGIPSMRVPACFPQTHGEWGRNNKFTWGKFK